MRRILAVFGALVLGACGYLLVKPVPIDPAPWTPTPNAGFRGPFAPNSLLTQADSILLPAAGPEDLTVGPDGLLYTGLADGRVLALNVPERFRISGAEPYGMIIGMDTTGRVTDNLQDPTGRFHATTGATVSGDTLYVGSLLLNFVGRLPRARRPVNPVMRSPDAR